MYNYSELQGCVGVVTVKSKITGHEMCKTLDSDNYMVNSGNFQNNFL